MYGHVVIICIGIPVIVGVVYNLRILCIRHILLLSIDKVKSALNALIQIVSLQQMIKSSNLDQSLKKNEDTRLTGIVNMHMLECQDPECPCKNDHELFNPEKNEYVKRNSIFHRDTTFLKYFNKKLFEDYICRFNKSPLLHIDFADFLFVEMKNVHAALLELDLAAKKKPSLKEQFVIHRLKVRIENSIKKESVQGKDTYDQLINVIKFEKLLEECQKAIEIVADSQVEFWRQIVNQLPDLNILDKLVDKYYKALRAVDKLWTEICNINPLYPKGLQMYRNYMVEIKNHNQIGYDLMEK